MHRTILTDEEIELLHSHQKTSPVVMTRYKCQVILMHASEIPIDKLCVIMNKDLRTIQRWLKDFAERRISSIFSIKLNN